MKSQLIFYKSKKTALNENALKSALSLIDQITLNINISMDEESLRDNIINYLKDNSIIFIIGTLTSINGLPAVDIFLRDIKVFDGLKDFQRLKTLKNSSNEPGGYIFENTNRFVIFLQDDPDQILFMMSNYIIPLINKRYFLEYNKKKNILEGIKFDNKAIKNNNNSRDRFSKSHKINSRMFFIGTISLIFIVIVFYLFFK